MFHVSGLTALQVNLSSLMSVAAAQPLTKSISGLTALQVNPSSLMSAAAAYSSSTADTARMDISPLRSQPSQPMSQRQSALNMSQQPSGTSSLAAQLHEVRFVAWAAWGS